MERALVQLVATGGTIAMAGSPAKPALTAAELVAAVQELESVAELRVEQLSNLPGVNLDPTAMARALALASEAIEAGAAGAVITQGTDTIEETAELAHLAWNHDAPLAITGAIRPGGSAGSDGPLNLLAAVRVAASSRVRGPCVVFDELVHSAAGAVKSHSWRTDAFSSPSPVAEVREGDLRSLHPQPARTAVATSQELAAARLDAYVPVVTATAGADSRPLDALRDGGAEALVIAALGAGHVPEAMLPGVDRALAAGLAVAVCARPPRGGTLTRTYGFEGSETDLASRGAILAGGASPWKARIRMLVALALRRDAASLFSDV
jgi:L-asparaginase